jgi:hypothetical protein
VVRRVWKIIVDLGWVAAALVFSAFSIAAVIGLAFAFRYVFFFLPDAFTGVAFLLAFVIYMAAVGWIAWQIIKKRAQIS